MRRKAGRDLAEAKGRKRARDAAYAWAAAEQRAVIRLHELIGEFQGALHRGTAPEVIAQFVAEACQRYDIDPGGVPEQIRATVGLPGAPAEPQPVPQPGPELDDSAGI
ncbi:hypothetical protein DFR70_13315 [Nocardia tenerifensis]|uniref:Uncharacterized protein n=2 Tax=Nocardia tenerifensis TaxID=228006 RepID=A0A318JRR7_9NOCA|nr:hypothetical protein DFR70_13315 [Nocardia tenerifensis]